MLLLGISPMIWRGLLVCSDSTIADLHHILQVALGWTNTHLHQFRIHGKKYGMARLGASASVTTPTMCASQTLASGYVNVSSMTMTSGTTGSTSSVSNPPFTGRLVPVKRPQHHGELGGQ